MNDFTKEELQEICQSIKATAFQKFIHGMTDEQNKKLIEKIQSMIDNYCEHKSILGCERCRVITCAKCGCKVGNCQPKI